ncbi:MAG: PAS domain S-box protein [Myxococcales bacterium]|nr:MAG: PAS domain S-box protein [Myxococcales bacterium]
MKSSGCRAVTFLKEKLGRFIDPTDLEWAYKIWVGFSAGRFPQNIDLKLFRKDGQALIVNASFAPLQDSEGVVLCTFRDVTEERHIASELVQTKEFLESLIQASTDAIIAWDVNRKVILFNQAACRATRYSENEAREDLLVSDLYTEGEFERVCALLDSEAHGGVGRLEATRLKLKDKNGTIIPVSLSAAAIKEKGEVTAFFGIYRDLRERVLIEERLAEAQQQLEKTEKQALLAELAGTAAHELNQPLMSIMAHGQWLQRMTPENTKDRNAANTIVSGS